MRNYSPFILERLSAADVQVFAVVQLGTTPPLRTTSLPYAVTIGGELYEPDTGVVDIDRPAADERISRDTYKISMTEGSSNNLRAQLRTGQTMIVRLGFFSEEGLPNLALANLIVLYSGRIDFWTRSWSMDRTRILQIQGVSPAGALGFTRGIYTDITYVKQFDATDDSMRDIGWLRSEDVTLAWGKAR